MMLGTEPNINRPGTKAGTVSPMGLVPSPEKGVSMPRLLALPEVAECTECPALLCLPSLLWLYVLSIIGWDPRALADLDVGSKSMPPPIDEERCDQ